MKKYWLLLAASMLIVFVTGCAKQGEAEASGDGGAAVIEQSEKDGAANPDAGGSEGP